MELVDNFLRFHENHFRTLFIFDWILILIKKYTQMKKRILLTEKESLVDAQPEINSV